MAKIWSDEEKQVISDNAHKMTDQEIANYLTWKFKREFSKQAVTKQRQKLGIAKKRGRGVCKLDVRSEDIAQVVNR